MLEPKTATDIKDYGVNWTRYLDDTSITFTSSWTVPSGITRVTDSVDDQIAVIRLSGGTAGTNYTLINTIVTSAGETLDQAIQVRVNTAAINAGL